MTKRRKTADLYPEYGVDSRSDLPQMMVSEAVSLMKYRLDKMKNLTDEDVQRARLLQFKYKFERVLSDPVTHNEPQFNIYLALYIDILFDKRSDFANEFGITPVELSLVVNAHRDASEGFLLKLTKHTDQTFMELGGFSKTYWFELFYRDKMSESLKKLDSY